MILVMVAMLPTSTDTLPSLLTRLTPKGTLQQFSEHPPNNVGPTTDAQCSSLVGVRSIT